VSSHRNGYVKLIMVDRVNESCDLIGVDNRPGFDKYFTNSNQFGVAGDSLTFEW
jgi:hypothetical protein